MLRRKSLFESTVIAGVALAALGSAPAHAQQPPAPPAPADTAAPPPAPDEAEEVVVITGSRIKTSEFTAASPVQVLTSEQADLKGLADVGQFLQSASVAQGSPQISQAISSGGFVTAGGPGSETVSLRGLGANRTLVLLNGRRAGPAGVRGEVSAFDLNVIPQSSIDRVDILKDGASSIYGSDAIAGVVNIITKNKPNGGELEVFGDANDQGGGEQFRVNGTWGKTFDRAHFSISGDYYKQNELKRSDRAYLGCTEQYIFDPVTGSRKDIIDPSTGTFKCRDTLSGQLWLYDYDYNYSADSAFRPGVSPVPRVLLQYDPGGTLLGYAPGAAYPTTHDGINPLDPGDLLAPPNWIVVDNPDHLDSFGVTTMDNAFIRNADVLPRLERGTLYFDGGLDITPDVHAYTELLLNQRKTRTVGFRQFWDYQFTEDCAFNYCYGPGTGDPLMVGFSGPWMTSPTPVTDHAGASQKVDYARIVAGLKGKFPGAFLNGWDWDAYLQYSKSSGDYTQDVILQDAVDAQSFRNGLGFFGKDVTCVGTNLPISGKPCIDINFADPEFLKGNLTPQQRAFLFDVETGHTDYTQKNFEASIAGDLFQMPAGPLGAAFGVAYREDEILDTPGPITLAGNSWGLSSSGITAGSDKTKEVFTEFKVPLIKDQPGFQDLSLSLSGRYTDVDSYGAQSTYKLGGNWQITPAVRLRASHGTSFRAPALFELYLAAQTDFASQRSVDPCINWGSNLASGDITQEVADNCAADLVPSNHNGAGATATVSSSGGLGTLKAETSIADSIGLVLTPPDSHLSIAIDYFDIRVADEVTKLGAGNVVSGCYSSASFPSDPLCALFTRDSGTHLITTVTDNYINIASQSNRGVDVTLRYTRDMFDGRLAINNQLTYQIEDTINLFPGSFSDPNGTVGDPEFVGNTEIRFDKGPWTTQWAMEYIGPSSDDRICQDTGDCIGGSGTSAAQGPFRAVVDTPWVVYHSASMRYKADDWSLLFGVANIFDQAPPRVSTLSGVGNYNTVGQSVLSSQYDYVGRRAFLNLSKQF